MSCPSGWTMIGDPGAIGTYCIETNERAATSYFNAKSICAGLKPTGFSWAHLCDHNEWYVACLNGTGLSNMTNNWEWVSDFRNSTVGGHAFIAGNGGCDTVHSDGISDPVAFRCCLR